MEAFSFYWHVCVSLSSADVLFAYCASRLPYCGLISGSSSMQFANESRQITQVPDRVSREQQGMRVA